VYGPVGRRRFASETMAGVRGGRHVGQAAHCAERAPTRCQTGTSGEGRCSVSSTSQTTSTTARRRPSRMPSYLASTTRSGPCRHRLRSPAVLRIRDPPRTLPGLPPSGGPARPRSSTRSTGCGRMPVRGSSSTARRSNRSGSALPDPEGDLTVTAERGSRGGVELAQVANIGKAPFAPAALLEDLPASGLLCRVVHSAFPDVDQLVDRRAGCTAIGRALHPRASRRANHGRCLIDCCGLLDRLVAAYSHRCDGPEKDGPEKKALRTAMWPAGRHPPRPR
jgi:hypothetical protein